MLKGSWHVRYAKESDPSAKKSMGDMTETPFCVSQTMPSDAGQNVWKTLECIDTGFIVLHLIYTDGDIQYRREPCFCLTLSSSSSSTGTDGLLLSPAFGECCVSRSFFADVYPSAPPTHIHTPLLCIRRHIIIALSPLTPPHCDHCLNYRDPPALHWKAEAQVRRLYTST
ncbi:hypothetical protein BD324DRAFT_267312 [Kockovaella imperatae]|uniref:Uncharacterized protein n=1 Tax=Kockovaella imperatae TaxID=4999 RepID=A0A1Y1UQ91_9TREE|nr:hypothetical protein BD324DRAFT_267312 [Kockovaella imperatae]ORX40230.1 hypothetical protein BD324DRAFT_267312 [Kockovaella imperatae]